MMTVTNFKSSRIYLPVIVLRACKIGAEVLEIELLIIYIPYLKGKLTPSLCIFRPCTI
jgi:hypothetical protein